MLLQYVIREAMGGKGGGGGDRHASMEKRERRGNMAVVPECADWSFKVHAVAIIQVSKTMNGVIVGIRGTPQRISESPLQITCELSFYADFHALVPISRPKREPPQNL